MNNIMSTGEKFLLWLNKEENLKGWTDYELAKQANVSHSMLSRARNDLIPPKWDALAKIAKALNRNPITAFRAAGLLSDGSDSEINFDDWKYLLEQLPPQEQEEMRQIATIKIERHRQNEARVRAADFKPNTKRRG